MKKFCIWTVIIFIATVITGCSERYYENKYTFALWKEVMISWNRNRTNYTYISDDGVVIHGKVYDFIKLRVTLPPKMTKIEIDGEGHFLYFAHGEQIFIYAPYISEVPYEKIVSSPQKIFEEDDPMFEFIYENVIEKWGYDEVFKNNSHHSGVNRFIVKDNFVVYLYHIRKKHLERYTNMILNSLQNYPPAVEDTLKADTITIYNGQ